MRLHSALVVLLFCLPFTQAPARSIAQWVEGGVPVTRSGYVLEHAQAADEAGGCIVVWSSWAFDPGQNADIYAQRVTPGGVLDSSWPTNGAVLCTAPDVQRFPKAVSDGSGGAIVVWADARGQEGFLDVRYGLYAHRVMADGSLGPGWPANGLAVSPDTCTTSGPFVVSDGSGGAYVAWSETDPARDVRLQNVTSSGQLALGWPAEGVLVCGAPNDQVVQKVVADGAGGVYIAWLDSREGGPDAYVQHVTASGERATGWPADGIRVSDGPGAIVPVGFTMCSDGIGGVLVFWKQGWSGNGFVWSLRSKRFAGDGSESLGWSSPLISTWVYGSDELPDCAPATGGGAFVAWPFIQSNTYYPIYAHRVLAMGASPEGWPDSGLPVSLADYNFAPQVASDGGGGAYIAWGNWTGTGSAEILVQRVLPTGSSAWVSGGISASLGLRSAGFHTIVSAGGDEAIVTWQTDGAVYAQKVTPGGMEYFSFAFVSADVDADQARLVWQAPSPVTAPVTVYRREGGGGWNAVRTVNTDPGGRVVCEDSDVVAGHQYQYRLGATFHGVERFYGEAQIQVPLFALGVRPVASNPIRVSLTFSLTLPVLGSATLQLIDVRGRIVESMDVGGMGVGRHTVTFGSSNRTASGVYFVRLSQGERTSLSKVVFVR